VSKKPLRTYDAHETERMQALHGVKLASFKSRSAAFGIDFVLLFALFLAILFLGAALFSRQSISSSEKIVVPFDFEHWYSLLLIVGYFALATYWGNGKTPGKWVLGIRVVSIVHEHISLWQSIERALGYGASVLEGGFGFLQYFIHPNRRTVHDRIAETIVIRDRKQKAIHQ
jgi:uncharacterized RDD family membrane protein YckC